jgi:hypothetical protein
LTILFAKNVIGDHNGYFGGALGMGTCLVCVRMKEEKVKTVSITVDQGILL